ncbi:MAG: alpha/beta hydrolase [Luteimonas sp.]
MAANGIVAVIADYRTYPNARFPGFMDDAAKAVAWTSTHVADYGGDPQRVFIAGHSAGAQIAALLGTDKRYLQRVGVPIAHIAGVIGLSGPYDFDVTGQYVPIFAPPSPYPDAQAINFVDGDEPPFLLIHGAADRIVEAKDSVELAGKLKTRDAAATLLLLPDSGHFATVIGLYEPKRAPPVLPAILRFVADPRGSSSRR